MTVSSSAGRQRTIGEVIRNAYRYAGLLSPQQDPTADEMVWGQQLLQNTIDRLGAISELLARAVVFHDLAIVAGTYRYNLPATTIDAVGDGMWFDSTVVNPTQAASETPVARIARERWHSIASKDADGIPRMFMVYRASDIVQAWVWPVPSEAGTVRLQLHRELADADVTTATLDVENFWIGYINADLARQLAESASLNRAKINALTAEAEMEIRRAKGRGSQGMPNQFTLNHKTGWHRA